MRTATNRSTPSLDAVLVWVTFTIERDYIARGVFPELRRATAVDEDSTSFLHYMNASSVRPILKDARARRDATSKGIKHAYTAFTRSLENAIKEAAGRRAIFEATEAVCTEKSEYYQHWRGTKEQLQAAGIKLAGAWPGEEGGKSRWAMGYSQGRNAYISVYSRTWPGLFKVRIEIPATERKASVGADERAKKRAQAEASLDAMPEDADEYRMKLIDDVRLMLSFIKPDPVDWHGFTLTDEGVEEILMSCDAVVEAILQAEVSFDARRHQQIRLKHQQQIAEADESFQHLMGELTSIRPRVHEGSKP